MKWRTRETVETPSQVVAKEGGKGRPTPKRSDARKKTPYTAPPKSRKEAYSRDRGAVKGARQRQLSALRAGDLRNLPAFAAGPERALVRDAVDSRHTYAWIVMPALIVSVVVSMISPIPDGIKLVAVQLPFLLLVFIVVDSAFGWFRLRKLLAQRYPDGTDIPRAKLIRYGLLRSVQFRRTRLPPPRVPVGGDY